MEAENVCLRLHFEVDLGKKLGFFYYLMKENVGQEIKKRKEKKGFVSSDGGFGVWSEKMDFIEWVRAEVGEWSPLSAIGWSNTKVSNMRIYVPRSCTLI